MAAGEIALDVKSESNTAPLSQPQSRTTDESVSEEDQLEIANKLVEAIQQRKWDDIKEILDRDPEAINMPLGVDEDTALVLAIREGVGMPIIEKLVGRMSLDDLGLCSFPALLVAASCGNLSVVKLLIDKNPNTVYLLSSPKYAAACRGQREMVFYLHSFTNFTLHVLRQRHPKIAGLQRDQELAKHRADLLKGVVGNPHGFESGKTQLSMFQSIIYSFGPIKNIRDLKLKHAQTFELVRRLCTEIKKSGDEESHTLVYHQFISAAQNGLTEVVEHMLKVFPKLRTYRPYKGKWTLHLVLPYRDIKIFDIIHHRIPPFERPDHYDEVVEAADDADGNNILHLVACKPRRNRLDVGSGVVLKMQRELQWFKGVEEFLPPSLINQKNKAGKTPLEIFEEEHQDLVKSEGEWIIGMANSCIVGGSLIATVVFAAAITVPGGNKGDGLPIFSKQAAFKVFAWSDTLALVSSLTAVVIFLSVFTTRHSINDFLYGLPHKLIIGLISLLLSVTFMMIAFSAIIYLVFAGNNNWIIFPIAVGAFVPVYFFLKLQLRSLLDMIRSTYRRSIFKPV